MNQLLNTQAGKWGVIVAVGAVAFYVIARKTASAATDAAVDVVAGVVTGENALTKDTPYEGYGVLGTLGAGFNAASGGTFQRWGESLGGWLFDKLNPDPLADQEAILASIRQGQGKQ